MRRLVLAATMSLMCATLGAMWSPGEAQAFCGFYVSDVDQPLYNSATQVAMMREGTKTVLSMRNNYKGPAKDFAMVIPVPQVLQEENVKTLDDAIFARLNKFTAPRMVEYYEENPCEDRRRRRFMARSKMADTSMAPQAEMMAEQEKPVVQIEAQFEVGEYEILILSASESNGLEKWLLANKYNIPPGAAKVLAPYIAQGQYFFVAKVNADKVKFDAQGRALLSPLRFDYDTEEFSLPVRLGLLNADGPQDLIVHVISKESRYKVANYPNVAIPTNVIIDKKVRPDFGTFYEQLFQATVDANPRSVITEFAWGGAPGPSQTPPAKCDPCVEPPAQTWESELWSLGAELLPMPAVGADNWRGAIVKTALQLEGVRVEVPEPAISTRPETPEGDPSAVVEETPEPVAPVAPKPAYDEEGARQKLQSQQPALEQCHIDMARNLGAALPMRLDLILEIDNEGRVVRAQDGTNDTASAQDAASVYGNCINSTGVRFAAPHTAGTKIIASLNFDTTAQDPAALDIRTWTVTRLHARYTAKDLGEDLIFEKAPPIIGGRGTPSGSNPKMDMAARPAPVNNFQARYMILYPYEDFHLCLRPRRGVWTGGGSSGTSRQMQSTLADGQGFNLREVIHSDLDIVRGRVRK